MRRPLLALAVLIAWIAVPPAAAAQDEVVSFAEEELADEALADEEVADEELGDEEFAGDEFVEGFEEEAPAEVGRTTIVPWEVKVLGKNFESFPNDEAAIVLADWLLNSLDRLNVFNVVNRDKMQAILSEQQLAAAGYSQDISPTALADAGKLLKVNYILTGNFKNLGKTTEVDFKLLDIDTATYTHTVNFPIPFNAEIESMKPEIDRIVADLAAFFPIMAAIEQIVDDRTLVVAAGTEDGVADAMEAEIWRSDGAGPEATGFVTGAWAEQSEVQLDQDFPGLNLFDHVVQIKIMPPAQAALKKGMRDLDSGDYQAAASAFSKGLEADPDDGLLHANYARSLSRAGDYKAAITAYRRALDLRPDDVPLLEDAAEAMLESGHAEELIQTLEQEERQSHSGKLALSYGKAKETLGHHEQAREAYREALKQDPGGSETHLRLGVLAAKQGDAEEAKRELGLAQRGGAESLELSLGAEALRLVESGDAGADTSALESLAEQAQSEGALSALATASEVLLVGDSLWQLSLDLAQRTLAVNPDYLRASIAAARAHAGGGQNDQAIAVLDQALAAYPNHVAMLLLSADLLAAGENLGEAESRYRRAAELAPDDWRASAALGDLYSSRGDHLQAMGAHLEALQRAEAVASKEQLVEHLYKLGRAAVQADQLDTARPHLERCVAQSPAHAECQFHLGLCYFADETPESNDKAIASFSAASERPETYFYLGALHQRKAELDQALLWHRKCVRESCPHQQRSERQIDLIESVTGSVTRIQESAKKVTLDIGRIHGVAHSREGVVVQGSSVVAVVRVEEVRESTSVAEVVKGSPLVGQTVRFRPTSPKGVGVKPHPKRGVVVHWRPNREAEVDYYEVYTSASPRGPWKSKRKVQHPDAEFVDRSIKPGQTVFFKIVAVSSINTRSPESRVVEGSS